MEGVGLADDRSGAGGLRRPPSNCARSLWTDPPVRIRTIPGRWLNLQPSPEGFTRCLTQRRQLWSEIMNISEMNTGRVPPQSPARAGTRHVQCTSTELSPATRAAVRDSIDKSGLSALLVQLSSQPEVRASVVSAAKSAVASGELLTRSAAESTAQAFLDG